MEGTVRTIFLSVAVSLCSFGAYADTAGLIVTEVYLPHHAQSTRVAVWYPSNSQTQKTLYANGPVFEGIEAHVGGAIISGQYPLVLFSHGMGGTDKAQAWLGAALAERGVVTVSINHPNSSWGNFDMASGIEHWTRALDISATLDWIIDESEFSKSIDMSRVMAAGYSYGGWTALSLGGALGNHGGIVEACTTQIELEACELFLSENVNMQGLDPAIWNARYADDRVTHVVAIDPGFVWGLTESDVADLLQSTTIIGFGGQDDRMLATDFDRSGLSELLGDRSMERFDPAYHFSAMPICTEAGEAILAVENDDPVCTDPAGSDRRMIHTAIVDIIAEDLDR